MRLDTLAHAGVPIWITELDVQAADENKRADFVTPANVQRLDTLAQAGVPIWITELDVQAADENKPADYYEAALTSVYSHPAVEGILIWGFWDQQHWRGEHASLVNGNNFHVNAAGRRVLDLLENRWMTDETHTLSQSGDHFSVSGFHGDYELRGLYQGHELSGLKQTFSLGKSGHTVNLNVHHQDDLHLDAASTFSNRTAFTMI